MGSSVMAWAFHSSHQKVCQALGNWPALTTLSIVPSIAGSGSQEL
ncbi:MAG: hypothetical protein ACKOWF_02945 [Chloroflexota bacterium]